MKSLNISFYATIAFFVFIAYIARGEDFTGLREAQNASVKQFITAVKAGDSNKALTWGKVTDQALAMEVRIVSNMTARAKAPQLATAPALDRAVALAKKSGVSGSVIEHAKTLWASQNTVEGAEQVIARLGEESNNTLLAAAAAGGFRRAIPAAIGGTTSFANWMTPRSGADITQDPEALARLTAALAILNRK